MLAQSGELDVCAPIANIGSRRKGDVKCNEAGGAFGAAECDPMATSCSVDIDWDDVPWAGGPECHDVWVQAHAAMVVDCETETAYGGESFKGNFCLMTPCCF
jgi:hypothetical protein